MSKDLPEEQTIVAALHAARGSQRVAAHYIGMSQSWLARWLKANGYVQVIRWEKAK